MDFQPRKNILTNYQASAIIELLAQLDISVGGSEASV